MRRALFLAICLARPVWAQADDRDYLTAFLEDTLSDAGRTVTVTGFAGALSSQATIEKLTIADEKGVWITLNDVVLDWSRSALFSGELNVSELSAKEIIVDRLPQTGDAGPSPAASGFSLPDLPVSVLVDRVAADRIVLAPEVLGQSVTGTMEASVQLSDGQGQVSLDLLRSGEGPKGEFTLDASYSNTSREMGLDLLAKEDAGGIVVSILEVPGKPSAVLQVKGQGSIDDFKADVDLATDGADRLKGTVAIQAAQPSGHRLLADLSGDLAPLLAPDQAAFFGTDVALNLDARRADSGRTTVDRFDFLARSVRLGGTAEIAEDGLPEWFDITGALADPDGTPVTLPFLPDTRVGSAEFHLKTRPGADDSWSGEIAVQGLDRPDLKVAGIKLTGSGRIGRTGAGNSFGGTLNGQVFGIAPTDTGLAAALGPEITGSLRMHLLEGIGALRLSEIRFDGIGLSGTGAARIEGLDSAFLTSGQITVKAEDLSRFSGLAGRKLGGAGKLEVSGSASRLSGFFDADLAFDGTGLSLDVPPLDRLLANPSRLTASIRRDVSGTKLRSLDLKAASLAVSASGTLATAGSTLDGQVTVKNLADLGPPFAGSVDMTAAFIGTAEDGQLALLGTGRGLRVGSPEADRLLAGVSAIESNLRLRDGAVEIDQARIANPQMTGTARGRIDAAGRTIDMDARLADLGLLLPELQGPLTLSGTASQDAAGYSVDLAGKGPGQISATVGGRLAGNFGTADLSIRGTVQAGLANLFIAPRSAAGLVGFDLRLRGPLDLEALNGRVTLSNGQIVDPGLGLSLKGVEATGDLQGGGIRLSAAGNLSSGGKLRIDGPIRLASPYSADLALTLDRVRLYNPELYDARLGGDLALKGPLVGGAVLSGALALAETEVRVPDSGVSSAAALMDIRQVTEPGPVWETRRRAGLLGGPTGGPSGGTVSPVGLNLTISAPSRLFVRGRGIDAELGGEIRLLGTTADVQPSGAFRLIRGRMDILGRRLVLSQADLVLEGSLVPQITVVASTENDGIISSVTVEGPADKPEVRFDSSPELPEEEVLAQLLFGRAMDKISALQAARLANAVAVLSGRGGVALVDTLRRKFGLDDLDVTTADDGTSAMKAGKYLSDNIYTEVEVDQDGKGQINLNLDLHQGVTVKGRVGADGSRGIGIFLERDY